MKPIEDVARLADMLTDIFGVEAFDDGAAQTARRVFEMWQEFAPEHEIPFKFTTFECTDPQMIVCDHIEFSSLCAHHLLPFYGYAHVAYIPAKLQVGLSKIPRLVKWLAKRPQVQEQLTAQIANEMKHRLDAHGVMVVVEARHTCMSCRGVEAHNGMMRTSLPKGVFLSSPAARDEFFELIKRNAL
jgi:GTP cyclohydrolase I